MNQVGTEIIVNWTDGAVRQLIEGDQWQGFSPRQKQQWLREMNSERNGKTLVRLVMEQQLTELFFHRGLENSEGGAAGATCSGTCFVCGKWVKLLHFQDVVDEARKFANQTV